MFVDQNEWYHEMFYGEEGEDSASSHRSEGGEPQGGSGGLPMPKFGSSRGLGLRGSSRGLDLMRSLSPKEKGSPSRFGSGNKVDKKTSVFNKARMSVKKSTRLSNNRISMKDRPSLGGKKKVTIATVMNKVVPSRGGPQNKESRGKNPIYSLEGGPKYRKLTKEGTPMSHFSNFDMEIGQHEIKTEINREVLKKVGTSDGMKSGKLSNQGVGFDFVMSECRPETGEFSFPHSGLDEGIQEEVSNIRRFNADPDSIAASKERTLTMRTEAEGNWICSKKHQQKTPTGSGIPEVCEFSRINSYNVSINAPSPT